MKKLTNWLLLCSVLLTLCSCSLFQSKDTVVYKDVPPNSIVTPTNAYSMDDWMIVKRTTYKAVWDSLIEKDSQLKECLEREKIKK